MELGELYCKLIRQHFTSYHANFPPNQALALGDFGRLKDEVFERLGNVMDLGIGFNVANGTASSNFVFKSAGSVDLTLVAKGDIGAGGVPATKAALNVHFSRENAVFFSAADCVAQQVADVRGLGESIVGLLDRGRWDSDWHVVTGTVNSLATTVLVSASADADVSLEATSDAVPEIDLASVSLRLRLKRSRNTALEVVTSNPQTPLMQLSRVKGFFKPRLEREDVQQESAFAFVSTEAAQIRYESGLPTTTLGRGQGAAERERADQSDFERSRAIELYLPLLEASYALARRERFELPNGFRELGEVRATPFERELLVSEAEREAIEKDRKALESEATAQDGREAIADPDAFGFVLEDNASGDIVISIRGTQTPEEWLADFTAIPVPFSAIPEFGLVHVGFNYFYSKVRASIKQALDPVDSDARITVLGHSLGGAMAILAAADVGRNFEKRNVDVCTFGGPRTGKIDFRLHFDRLIPRCFRVVNAGDLVPLVPPVLTLWNHVGTAIHIEGTGGTSRHSLAAYMDGMKNVAVRSGREGVGSPKRVRVL